MLFDLGGVIVDSPVAALADLEKDKGLPKHAINKAVATAGPEVQSPVQARTPMALPCSPPCLS